MMQLSDLPAHLQVRIHVLTGGSATTLEEALDQWENTDLLFRDFQETHDQTRALNVKYRTALLCAQEALALVRAEGNLFLSQKVLAKLELFDRMLKQLKGYLEPEPCVK